MYLNFELIFRLLLELLEPEQLPLLYLDLDKVLQIGNKFGKIFLILLMMTMLLILPLMMEFKEVEDSLLQCCYVWHGIVQVWLFSVKAIFTKKFHENDFTEFFFFYLQEPGVNLPLMEVRMVELCVSNLNVIMVS